MKVKTATVCIVAVFIFKSIFTGLSCGHAILSSEQKTERKESEQLWIKI